MHLHVAQPGRVVQEELNLVVQLLVVVRLDVQHKIRVGQAHVPLEGQIIRPAPCIETHSFAGVTQSLETPFRLQMCLHSSVQNIPEHKCL